MGKGSATLSLRRHVEVPTHLGTESFCDNVFEANDEIRLTILTFASKLSIHNL